MIRRPFYKNLQDTSNKIMYTITDSPWNYCTSANTVASYYKSLSVRCLWWRFLTLSFLYQTQHVSCRKAETAVQCFACNSISIFRFCLLYGRKYAPNIECIFYTKAFMSGSLSLLTNFQNLSTAVILNLGLVNRWGFTERLSGVLGWQLRNHVLLFFNILH